MAQTTTPAEPDKPEQVARGLKLVDPETASQPIKNALALLPLINVFRAMANAETLYPYFGTYVLQTSPLKTSRFSFAIVESTAANERSAKWGHTPIGPGKRR